MSVLMSTHDHLLHADPPDYLEQLETYLNFVRGSEYFDGLWYSYTDIDRFERYLDLISPYKSLVGASVLDMGAGTGGMLLACRKRGAERLIGVEVNLDLHRLAKMRLAGSAIEVWLTDGLEVPLPDSSFDIILSLQVLEHTMSPSAYLSEIKRLLRPDGIVLLSCPNRVWPHEYHGNLPLITYLPMWLSRRYCLWRSKSTRLSAEIRRQFYTATLVESYFSFLGVRRLCRKAGLAFLEANAPARFVALDNISYGAWGRQHRHVERFANSANRWLVRDRIEPFVQTHPLSRFAHWLALLLNWEISAVLCPSKEST